MRAHTLSALIIAPLLIVSILGIGVAEAQLDTGESYWGENMMNGIFHLWPAVAIAIFAGLLAGGVFGLYELDRATMLFLFAASAFLAYHFYWRPIHAASVQSRDHLSQMVSGASNIWTRGVSLAARRHG